MIANLSNPCQRSPLSRGSNSGFTLIELIFSIMLVGIIAVVAGRFMLQAYRTFIVAENIAEIDWNGLIGMQKIVDDIHQVRSAADISTVSASQMTFTDINGNSIQYQLSGSQLLRNAQPVAGNISAFSLSYRDKNGNTTSTPSAVRYVSITLGLSKNNLATTFSSTAATRSFL